ncbi:MAG: hypothetical protein ACMUIE_04860, partial [Thermoplasmatota archaeon]
MKADLRAPALFTVILLLGALLVFLLPSEVIGQEESGIRLFIDGQEELLSKEKPQIDPNPVRNTVTVESGGSASFHIEYPLTGDMDITGRMESGSPVMDLHLEGLLSGGSDKELTVDVYSDPLAGSSVKIAGAILDSSDLESEDLPIPFISSQGYTVKKGSTIRLELSYSATGTLPILSFNDALSEGSHLEFQGSVFIEDAVGISVLGSNGKPVEEVIPYGPLEARQVDIIVSVRDLFGAYDVDTINVVIASSSGNVIWNSTTDTPDPRGGEELTYYNDTFEVPEATPTDTYTITATAVSFTGQRASAGSELIVAPGLFLALQEEFVEVDAGDIAVFGLEVLNGGDANDRIEFSAVSSRGWEVDIPPSVEIEGGEVVTVEFRVYVPLKAAVSDTDTLEMTANSRNADKDYSIEGGIRVKSAATYGIEPVGSTSKNILSGSSVSYSVRVVNLQSGNRTFEMSVENIPDGWDVEYSSDEGRSTSALYQFEVNGSGELVVEIIFEVPSSGPYGSSQFSISVRAKGEADKKFIYLTANVVDDSRDLMELVGGASVKTASRSGTAYPVTYAPVYFSLLLYNPGLQELSIDLEVDTPQDWDPEFNYDSIDLLPGEESKWNISIQPPAGASWQGGESYVTDVSLDAGAGGQLSQRLEVQLPKVTSITAEKEWDSRNVVEGNSVPVNITFRNRGNHDESLQVTFELPPELARNDSSPVSISLVPGETEVLRETIKVLEVKDAGTVTFKVNYETSKGTTTLDFSLSVSKKKESDGQNIPLMVAVIAGIVILAVVGYLAYTRFIAGRRVSKKEQKKPA